MTPERVLLTGGCQAPGLAAALRLLLPRSRVEVITWAEAAREQWRGRVAALAGTEVWLSEFDEAATAARLPLQLPGARRRRLPVIHFRAFQPDTTWIERDGAAEPRLIGPTGSPYHSALVRWAWQRGLPCEQALALFTPETFAALGYLDGWQGSIDFLARRFAQCGLPFERFALRLQRAGSFMHTLNHPRIGVLVALARELALELGAPATCLSDPVEDFLEDTLASIEWPVYPGIADRYGLAGSYRWKGPRGFVHDLPQFVAESYRIYDDARDGRFRCPAAEAPEFAATLEKLAA